MKAYFYNNIVYYNYEKKKMTVLPFVHLIYNNPGWREGSVLFIISFNYKFHKCDCNNTDKVDIHLAYNRGTRVRSRGPSKFKRQINRSDEASKLLLVCQSAG